MKQYTDAIASHIQSEFPNIQIRIEPFTARNGWLINCEIYLPEYKIVVVEVFPEHIELMKADRTRIVLPWELPELFEIVEKEIALVAQLGRASSS